MLDVTRTPRPPTPRGLAEPRLNAFVANLLGVPTRVHTSARIVSPIGATLATLDLTLADLGLGPLDVIALRDRAPGASGQSEVEQRFARVAWSRRPTTTPAGSTVAITLERNPASPPGRLSVDELLTAARSARALVATARAATLSDFASPDQPIDLALDTADLQARADQAVAALAAARARLDDGSALDVALAGAALFGVEGGVPSVDGGSWSDQASRVRTELDARRARLVALDGGFSRVGASTTTLRDHDLERLRVVFGADFRWWRG